MRRWVLATLLALLAGCAGSIPAIIRQAPPGNPPENVVGADVHHYIGAHVRWGGTIVKTENRPGETELEIVSRELQTNGRPVDEEESGGRFLARYAGFLDPTIFMQGRLVTVVGTVAGDEQRLIGQYSYDFPVLHVEAYFLWAPEPPLSPYPDVYPYDPWWPYAPYPYPYPWWHPRHH